MRRMLCALLLGGCFGEPPTLASPDDDEDPPDESSSSASSSTLPSTSSTAGTGGSDETGSDDNGSSFAPTSGDASSSSSEGSSESSSSSSGEPPYDGPYGDCWEGPVQTEEGEYLCPPSPCVIALPEHSACAPECGAGCESGPGGAAAVCLPTIAVGTLPDVCVMPCAGAGADCGELDCMDSTFEDSAGNPIWLCMWGAP